MAKKQVRQEVKKKEGNPEGIFIPAGLFLGFGIGFATGNVPAGMFSGLGLGFLLFGIAAYYRKKR